MPTLPITVPNVFANATSNIALSLLDADFLAVSQAINGIGNGSTPLTNVTITGGTLTNTTLNSPAISGGSMTGTNLSNVTITGAATLSQHGQCRLIYSNANQIILHPYNGQAIQIAGMIYAIPPNGVSLTNAGMIANTLYYIYAFVSGGALALEFSTNGHVASLDPGNYGVEVKQTDGTHSLVGMIRTTGASGFSDTDTFRGVASWFNRRNVSTYLNGPVNGFSTSNAWIDFSLGTTTSMLWGDEALYAFTSVYAVSSATAENLAIRLTFNGNPAGQQGAAYLPIGGAGTAVDTYNFMPGEAPITVGVQGLTPGTDPKNCVVTLTTITRQ
jgi:hypothetical protein